ncbi:MAG: hypothetical protein JEZ07_05960 [Phycisphaerae bacterium]|nr:hypothetical protein [Phycisphaerae bacterium]
MPIGSAVLPLMSIRNLFPEIPASSAVSPAPITAAGWRRPQICWLGPAMVMALLFRKGPMISIWIFWSGRWQLPRVIPMEPVMAAGSIPG